MKKFKILIPCYNDWQSLFKLLNNITNVNMKSHSKYKDKLAHNLRIIKN